jgi:hypothetical protein
MLADRVGQGRQDHGRVEDGVLNHPELQRQGQTGYFLSEAGSEKREVKTLNRESPNVTLCSMFSLPVIPRRSRLARTLSDPVPRAPIEGRHLRKHADRVEASDPVRTLSSPRHTHRRPSACAPTPRTSARERPCPRPARRCCVVEVHRRHPSGADVPAARAQPNDPAPTCEGRGVSGFESLATIAGRVDAATGQPVRDPRPKEHPMPTTILDPGKSAPTVPPHPGDKAAQRIRAALKRVKAQATR